MKNPQVTMSNDLDDLGPTHLWKPEIGVVSHRTLVTVTRYTSYDTWEFHLRQVGTGNKKTSGLPVYNLLSSNIEAIILKIVIFRTCFVLQRVFIFLSLAYDFGQVSCPDQWCFSMGNQPGNDKLSQV